MFLHSVPLALQCSFGSIGRRSKRNSSQVISASKLRRSFGISTSSLTKSKEKLPEKSALENALQNEDNFIKEMEQLLMLLHHPGLQGNVLSLENFIRNVNDLLTVHRNLKEDMSSEKCSAACAFFNFMPYLTFYLDYCCYLKRIHLSIEKVIGQCEKQLYERCAELLQAPLLHISTYEKVLCKLREESSSSEKLPLQEIQSVIKKTALQMTAICHSTENALKMLWIQKCLVNRQPKIFVPGRVLLKEGSLLKMTAKKRYSVERVLFLFDDVLLCCKKVKKCENFYKRASLKCCAVISLTNCSALLVHENRGSRRDPVLKLCWGQNHYLLFSNYVGDVHSWLETIQEAIRHFKQVLLEQCNQCDKKPRGSTLKRSAVISRKSQIQHGKSSSTFCENGDTNSVRKKCFSLSDSKVFSADEEGPE